MIKEVIIYVNMTDGIKDTLTEIDISGNEHNLSTGYYIFCLKVLILCIMHVKCNFALKINEN